MDRDNQGKKYGGGNPEEFGREEEDFDYREDDLNDLESSSNREKQGVSSTDDDGDQDIDELEDTIDFDQYDFDEEDDEDLEDYDTSVEEGALWSKQFADQPYVDDDGVPSRVQKRKADNKLPNNLVTIFIVIILIIIITTVAYVWYLNNRSYDRFENDQNSIEMISNSESIEESQRLAGEESEAEESRRAEEESIRESQEESSRAAEESESLAQEQAAQESQSAAEAWAESSRQAAQQAQDQQNQQVAGTYTVQAGDNLYRIAQNNGVSLEALLQANGMTANSNIQPGQTLIIPAQ